MVIGTPRQKRQKAIILIELAVLQAKKKFLGGLSSAEEERVKTLLRQLMIKY